MLRRANILPRILAVLSALAFPVPSILAATTPATFTVTLSEPNSSTVKVGYATVSGTASAGEDFVPVTGTITFPPGSTSQTIEVLVIGDRVFEGDETFTVELSNPVGASIEDGEGEGTIVDDDLAGLSIEDLTTIEPFSGSRVASFTVTLTPTSGSTVTVDYSTSAGTATPGSDYGELPVTTLTFPPGTSTLPVDVLVYADALTEGAETFEVNLANPSGASIAYDQAIGTIHDAGGYHTLTPCRVMNTRNPSGPYGGPALAAGESRAISLAHVCGVPPWARAVSLNLTVTEPTTTGNLRLYPAGDPAPTTSSLNYAAGQTRANNAVAALSATAGLAIRCTQASGTAHVIVDVSGYFE